MCLAEALLRIPDNKTADRLIADKISKGDWHRHLGESPSLFVNATTWGLLITGKLVDVHSERGLGTALSKLIAKGGEPLIRKGVDLAMRMLGNQFVTGQTIGQALQNSIAKEARGYRYSYDMLGEAAMTEDDASRYCAAYEAAIHAIGAASKGRGIHTGPGISVKLSALHPRYSRAQHGRVMQQLLPRLRNLIVLAKNYDIGINIDAEETDRLELSLDLMEALAFDEQLSGFDGIGFVVQAYQKRCPFVIDFLADLARRSGRKFMVRLVKGAYWDSEIKRAQVDGMPEYPVYTRKVYTDLSYLTCAGKLLAVNDVLYPQFATHNAHTLSTIYTWAKKKGITHYEFQCLHGMGETLYDQVVGADNLNRPCRIYAPVGSHETLLPYLVRRLLENGANSSFVNQIVDEKIEIATLVADPVAQATLLAGMPHPYIALPSQMFGSTRKNSSGLDLSDESQLHKLSSALKHFNQANWQARPSLRQVQDNGKSNAGKTDAGKLYQAICNPADRRDIVGHVSDADREEVDAALAAASTYFETWKTTTRAERAAILYRAADLFELHRLELMALAIREAGKSIPNAIAEIREAVDFLRYYSMQIDPLSAAPLADGKPLGPLACISPWNFPLAIFTGQVAAALAAGNVVLAKPAEQTPLIAARAVQLMHQAGIPEQALLLLPGSGEVVGAALTHDSRVKGVIFTGSSAVAQSINRTLAQRAVDEGGLDLPLIAETGGQNAMIVDSSALPEQVVQDVLMSAFDSAGQRCSALRVLYVQQEIADKVITMLKGAMQELKIGNPDRLATDIGPVIDSEAQQVLQAHIGAFQAGGANVFSLALPETDPAVAFGTFVAPTIIEIKSLSQLTQEIFGPVLHVIRYRRDQLPQVVETINASGYGLTLGIHTRIDETVDFITGKAHVGNIYVNRNIVGAVVGVQPFGGEGNSGTGPKAGGPLYLHRLQQASVEAEDVIDARATPALIALQTWAQGAHRELERLCTHYARCSLSGTSIMLPGPTGENNSLAFAARGTIFCAASDTPSLLNQIAAVLASGNRIVLSKAGAALLPPALPNIVMAAIDIVEEVKDSPMAMALLDRESALQWQVALAQREGAVVGVILTKAMEAIALWRLVAERALCINTTAAGGNASLMTLEIE